MSEINGVTVIIPAYNEAGPLEALLRKITELGYHQQYEILVVDDGSSDGTSDVVRQFPVKLLSHSINRGYGAALKTGIRHAEGKYVIMLDSDGQHNPEYIPMIEEMLMSYDLVIGQRSACSIQDRSRLFGKSIIRWLGEYLFSQKLPDFNSGLRGFRRKLIKRMLHLMPNGFSFSTTSTMAFIQEGYQIGTLPVDVIERQGRSSNVSFFRDGAKTIMLLLRIIMLFNPLKIFLPLSIIITLLGFAWGIYSYLGFSRFANSAIVIMVLGMFLFFIGLVADQIAIINRRHT